MPTLPRILIDWEGGDPSALDVYTDNHINKTELTPQDGRDLLARVPEDVYGVITDDERGHEPGRDDKLALRLRAIDKLSPLPVSDYANVGRDTWAFYQNHAASLARRGIDVGSYQNKTLADRILEPLPDYRHLARRKVLDASAWSNFCGYATTSGWALWMDAAIIYEGAKACRQCAPNKKCVAYLSPIVFNSDDMGIAVGLMEMPRWRLIVAATLEACDHGIVWGAEDYMPASEVPHLAVAREMGKAA